RLRPGARIRLVPHAGDDGSVAVQCLIDIVELVVRTPDIGTGPIDVEGLVAGCIISFPGHERAANINALPWRRHSAGDLVVISSVGPVYSAIGDVFGYG